MTLFYFLNVRESTFETRKYIFSYTCKAIFFLKILKSQNFRTLNFVTCLSTKQKIYFAEKLWEETQHS